MNELIAALRESLAHDAVIAADAIDPRYLGDWLLHDEAVRPAALVRPSSTAESIELKIGSRYPLRSSHKTRIERHEQDKAVPLRHTYYRSPERDTRDA